MRKIIFVHGLTAGLIMVTLFLITVPLLKNGTLPFSGSMILGYISMALAFSFVFFGVRSYRDKIGNGFITFGRAFGVGILIVLLASILYAIAWLFIYYFFWPDFLDMYGNYVTEEMIRDGKPLAEIEKQRVEMQEFKALYANPLINAAFTILEPMPVGLLMTLVAAFVFRKKPEKEAVTV
ncbi:MAG TPA: DUF4199 domain-containing protein [Bacteroidia bacterium]|nr:DUF4199 domain-containing protein [Bacteroidia bacterium]